MLRKTLVVNSAIVLLGAVAGTYFTTELAGRHSGVVLASVFFAFGAAITILANYLAFWDHFRPLVELSRALQAIRGGQEARQAIQGMRAAGLGQALSSVRTLLDRIEDDTLQLSARLLGSLEQERQRIGRELHDNTGQVLATAILSLGLAERQLGDGPPEVRRSVASARELVQRSLDQLKTVIYDLRPVMLDDLGLSAALRWYVKSRVEPAGVEVIAHVDEPAERLPPDLEIALYRIAQEGLANVVRHAQATRVELGLEIRPGFAALHVFDNGRGFDADEARGHGLGLLSMRERSAQQGGELTIVTAPGEGTRLYAVLPLASESADTRPTT